MVLRMCHDVESLNWPLFTIGKFSLVVTPLCLSQVFLCLQVWEVLLPCLHPATEPVLHVHLPLASREDLRCHQDPLVSHHAFLWELPCHPSPPPTAGKGVSFCFFIFNIFRSTQICYRQNNLTTCLYFFGRCTDERPFWWIKFLVQVLDHLSFCFISVKQKCSYSLFNECKKYLISSLCTIQRMMQQNFSRVHRWAALCGSILLSTSIFVLIFICVCYFVSRITQKLLNQIPWNCVGRFCYQNTTDHNTDQIRKHAHVRNTELK